MFVFPSREWCEAVITAVHAHPDCTKAGNGWEGDFAVAILADSPHLEKPFIAYARSQHGRLSQFQLLDSLHQLDTIKPAHVARAKYSVWKRLLLKQLDPVEALIKHEIDFQGDLRPVMERMQFADLLWLILDQVPTTFVDGAAPANFWAKEANIMVDQVRNGPLQRINKAVERILSDDTHTTNVAKLVGAMNKSKQSVEQAQHNLMKTLGLVSRRDYQEMNQRISVLKRRMCQLTEKLSK